MKGVPTPEAVELEWRKHYLVTGNVAGAAKAVGLPPPTGYELRNRAHDDPAFMEARRKLREQVLPDAEQMAVAAMQICMERLNADPVDIERLIALGSGKIHIQDAGPQYAASLAKLMQAITQGRRQDSHNNQSNGPIEVHVHLSDEPDDEPEGDVEPESDEPG